MYIYICVYLHIDTLVLNRFDSRRMVEHLPGMDGRIQCVLELERLFKIRYYWPPLEAGSSCHTHLAPTNPKIQRASGMSLGSVGASTVKLWR